jgi:type II restriction/modification system DNA methylase subunit YeeA
LPNFSDLCCYWFEKARAQIESGKTKRVGLLATQGIRGGLNCEVLKRVKRSGDIFFAWANRKWVQGGANVGVSMVGFDDGSESSKHLDGCVVETINPDLTFACDVTRSRRLAENQSIGFYADVKAGKFDIPLGEAIQLLNCPNPHGKPNSDVLRPWSNGRDVVQRPSNYWIIDFGVTMNEPDASLYEQPYRIVRERVEPERRKVNRKRYREFWWLHAEPCGAMRRSVSRHCRFIATSIVSKFRIFS